ncbi:hypothetical protein [Lapidilactobacillus wuchangensis]|uniref:hypothetical protein n=1 Tax=Lapidilactobacillus wuchangensis TaxID=2486001 RepID=UPI0013DDB8A2|nr:hypothetical protein [Lapidilactobacillus wuchangensis]
MEGSWRQPPNYCWCFSTYNKTCIGDFLKKGFNQRRQRSTTSKPAMQPDSILFAHLYWLSS